MGFLSIIPVSLILPVLLFQKVDVKIHRDDNISVTFNFTFVSLTLFPRRGKRKKGRFKAFKKAIENLTPTKRSVDFLLSKCNASMVMHRQMYSLEYAAPLSKAPSIISFYSVAAYMKGICRSFHIINAVDDYHSDDDVTLFLTFRLYYLFISMFFFLYYKMRKRVRKEA